jgi:acetyl-CoA acetyltransferase
MVMASAAHVDAFAVESQRRAAEAISAGRFDRSIIIVVRNGNGEIALTRDETNIRVPTRPWTS